MRIPPALIIPLALVCGLQALAVQTSQRRLYELLSQKRAEQSAAGQNGASEDVAYSLQYYVYTRHNADQAELIEPDVESVIRSVFQPWKPPRKFVFIPRWGADRHSPENQVIVETKLQQDDCNVLIVDWSGVAQSGVKDASSVAEAIADFLILLNKHFDVQLAQIHLAGFSAGAHVAGLTGRNVFERMGVKVQHITALDPTVAAFADDSIEGDRLSAEDGSFVEVVHTSIGSLGYEAPLGHADYYPNGGAVQPNCNDNDIPTCSHERAYEFVREMWSRQNDFVTTKCASTEDMSLDTCTWVNVKMGQNLQQTGVYYLETNGKFPYAKGSFIYTYL